MKTESDYLPIEDYGAIGNLRTVALVGLNGSIDWCCLPEVDSDSVFARLLDSARGGCFRVSALRPLGRQQRYIPFTNVLETTFESEGGRLVVTDFMPLDGRLDAPDGHSTAPEIYRLVRADGGNVEVEVLWEPRFDYAREVPRIEPTPGGFVAHAGESTMVLGGVPDATIVSGESGPSVRSRFTLLSGDELALVTRWNSIDAATGPEALHRKLDETISAWRAWSHNERQGDDRLWAGYWNEHVVRSELALKLMTFAPSGAIAAAPTTSLPEGIGGIRNWDYRFSWIRDAGLSAQAFNAMGHTAEAGAYVHWAERVSRKRHEEAEKTLHIMYSVRGEHCLPEEELDHLDGYRGSRPVRIGNMAAEQLQLDIYGDLITAAYEYVRMGRNFDDDIWQYLSRLADKAMDEWRKPDDGIWEFRSEAQHFVYSKVMVWVALQRACVMVARGHMSGDVEKWATAQHQIAEEVLEKGYDRDLGAFTISYGMKDLDAANLLLPLREFLPFEDPRVQSTIDRTLERLTVNDLVYRYRVDDGLPGEEGAFVLCTFWLVDALALSGRLDEAYRIFDGLAGRVNHLGLLSEQIDPENGTFLGNFPQAFSHIGLINSALYLAHMEGRETPVPEPIGTMEHRAAALKSLETLPVAVR